MMEYKGYTAEVEYDPDAHLLHGQVMNLRDVITFQARSVDELREEFHASVDDYLEFCAKRGEEPERPYSGRIALRIEPGLHRAVVLAAARRGQSVNGWIASTLERRIASHDPGEGSHGDPVVSKRRTPARN